MQVSGHSRRSVSFLEPGRMDIDAFLEGGFASLGAHDAAAAASVPIGRKRRRAHDAVADADTHKHGATAAQQVAGEEAGAAGRQAKAKAKRSQKNSKRATGSSQDPRGAATPASAGSADTAAGAADGAADVRALQDEVRAHKAELEALRTADPEFYAYLQASDAGLLAFDEAEFDLDGGSEAGSEGEGDAVVAAADGAAAAEAADSGRPGAQPLHCVTARPREPGLLIARDCRAVCKARASAGTLREAVMDTRVLPDVRAVAC